MKTMNFSDITQDTKLQNQLARVCGHHLPTVAVIGAYSHGKSSLLNCLMKKDRFTVSDQVETLKVQEHVADGIAWMDTPGLYADVKGKHDNLAHTAIYRADHLLLVHRASTGELDENEVRCFRELSKIAKSRCSVVISAIDEIDTESLSRVIARVSEQLPDTPVISVSATRYRKGRSEKKAGLVRLSNMDQLKAHIHSALSQTLAQRPAEKSQVVNTLRPELDEQIQQLARERARLSDEASRLAETYEIDTLLLRSDFLHKFANAI